MEILFAWAFLATYWLHIDFGSVIKAFLSPHAGKSTILYTIAEHPLFLLRKQGAMGLEVLRLGRSGFIPDKCLRYKRLPRPTPLTLTQGETIMSGLPALPSVYASFSGLPVQ